jgi:hypothetical protein
MKWPTFYIIPALLAAGAAISATGDEVQNPDGTVTTVITAPALPYQPFRLSDLLHPHTGQPVKPGEPLSISIEGKLTFQGHAEELLALLNDTEKYLTSIGQTLRQDGNMDIFKILANKDGALHAQMARGLKLRYEVLQDKIKTALKDCTLLQVSQLGIHVKTQLPFRPEDKVELEGEISLTAQQLVDRFNEQQQLLCSLGYSLYADLSQWGNDVVGGILSQRSHLMSHLGISKFHPAFSLQSIGKLKDYAQMGYEVGQILAAGKVPGPQTVFRLTRQINTQLPPDLQIPEIPNIPSPSLKRRTDLKLKKRKEWPGINEGNRSLFNVYANAWAEVRGDKVRQWAGAEGKGGFFLLGRELNVLTGIAELSAEPEEVKGRLLLTFVGQNISDKSFSKVLSYTIGNPKALSKSVNYDYSKTFMVGPVPVAVSVGALGEVNLGWNVGLTTLSISAGVTPSLDVRAYARGGVGVGGFISAGAEGKLLLIRDEIPLEGNAAVRFDDAGVPFLSLAINAENRYETLSGNISAYAEFVVPAPRIPPWKTKRATYELFAWEGFRGKTKIMNWGMDLSPFGAKMKGDLVDQADVQQAEILQNAILLDERRVAVAQLENQAAQEEHRVFTAIATDLNHESNAQVPALASALESAEQGSNAARIGFLNRLAVE